MLKWSPLASMHARKHLWHSASSWRRWTEAVSDEGLVRLGTKSHQLHNGSVAQKMSSFGMDACTETFATLIKFVLLVLNTFTLTTYVSPFKANTSANWNAVSRQIWRGCHTFVDSGDLNQAPPKQLAVCSTCIIPALPVNCQFIWMACAFGMSATQPILGWL